jgi:hypothetical protein
LRTVAAPKPLDAPVTTAVFPFNSTGRSLARASRRVALGYAMCVEAGIGVFTNVQ